jgi:two-component system, NtrC family, response regulator HydG
LRASDLKLEELVDFGDGWVGLKGRRLVLHSIHAFAQFRKDLLELLGPEDTRRLLTRFGYYWGNADAAAMKRIFQWDSLSEWLRAGPRMHGLQGVVKTTIKAMDVDQEAGRFRMEVTWRDSGEAQEHLLEVGRANEPICWMLVGYASGYASFCFDRPVYFIEDRCCAQGGRVCSAVGMDESSWGDRIEAHRSFFQSGDIQGKVLQLSQELREKTQALERQRRRLDALEHQALPALVEVRSDAFRRVIDLAARVAPFGSSVLITGESGVGKEVLARYIHQLSDRSKGPFVAVHCGALPETLLESELFGHKAGAFTGAMGDRVGLFEEATRGVILLDEIGDTTPAMQVELLRVLQQREILRVGENRPRSIDVRVIAATNRDLAQSIREGRFREDLFYRLSVIEIQTPPLRERSEDILPLARHFVKQFAQRLKRAKLRLDAACLDYLQAYHWPGNVRELENAIKRAAVLTPDGMIRPEHLPPTVTHARPVSSATGPARRSLAQVQEDHIARVLELTGGNRSHAARILEISPSTLWRKLKHRP